MREKSCTWSLKCPEGRFSRAFEIMINELFSTEAKIGINQKEEWNNLKQEVREGKLVYVLRALVTNNLLMLC